MCVKFTTRRLENDNTPQPLDQWMNSPFMGQQIGNCKSFTLTHYQGQSHCASNIISNSYPFHSKWVDLPIREIQQFKYFTLKIQGQGHGWCESWKSQHGPNISSAHIPFIPCQLAISFGFLRCDFFKIWPWKSKVKVTVEVKSWKSQSGCNILSTHITFIPCQSTFHSWDTKITMTVHKYKSRQVHKTLNGLNPSSGFRDLCSTKSGSNLCQIWQFFCPWASPYWANGQMTMTVHNYRPRQFARTSNGENPSSGYRDMGSASLAAGHAGGLRGKKAASV